MLSIWLREKNHENVHDDNVYEYVRDDNYLYLTICWKGGEWGKWTHCSDNVDQFLGDDNDNDIDDADNDIDELVKVKSLHPARTMTMTLMMIMMMTPRLGRTRGGRAEVMVRATTGRRAGSRKGCNREMLNWLKRNTELAQEKNRTGSREIQNWHVKYSI